MEQKREGNVLENPDNKITLKHPETEPNQPQGDQSMAIGG